MSFTISVVSPDSTTFDSSNFSLPAQAPVTKPTTNEQILTLASGGQSAAVIAYSLGVPITQVDTALGITSSSTSQVSALLALAGRLSVQG
jgi:hypothetical protein